MASDQSRIQQEAQALFMDYLSQGFLAVNWRETPEQGINPQQHPDLRYGLLRRALEDEVLQTRYYARIVQEPLQHVPTILAFKDLCRTFRETLRKNYENTSFQGYPGYAP